MSSRNRDLDAAWKYHEKTKHTYRSVRSGGGTLDWANRPIPFKLYPTLDPIPLHRVAPQRGMPALDAIAATTEPGGDERVPDVAKLAEVLHFSAGITRHVRGMDFRAASCTGALYHIDLYLICCDLPGLGAGVYHFGPQDFSLRRLRQGDYRRGLIDATGGEPSVATAPVIVALTSTYWRNAWKYRSRTYRHVFWDGGTILANLLAAAASRDLPASVLLGFADDAVHLLGLDAAKEAVFALVALGRTKRRPAETTSAIPPISPGTSPVSEREYDYPAIREMHAASSLASGEDAAAWRSAELSKAEVASASPAIPLTPFPNQQTPTDAIDDVVLRRGSAREFLVAPITFEQLSTIIDRSTRGIGGDIFRRDVLLNDLYLIVHSVQQIPSGAYVFHRGRGVLELLKEGEFRREAGYLGLEQALPATASVDVFLLVDLRDALQRLGNRGYRSAQLEAAILAGKMYLAAYALGLGATGLTFYDDDVVEFFSPHAAGKDVMFLIAIGRPKPWRSGR